MSIFNAMNTICFYFADPEPPTCDYAPYCAVINCTKTGATALCPDQCSK